MCGFLSKIPASWLTSCNFVSGQTCSAAHFFFLLYLRVVFFPFCLVFTVSQNSLQNHLMVFGKEDKKKGASRYLPRLLGKSIPMLELLFSDIFAFCQEKKSKKKTNKQPSRNADSARFLPFWLKNLIWFGQKCHLTSSSVGCRLLGSGQVET